jgi:hypothetical protein
MLDDAHVDDDPYPLNFPATVLRIIGWVSFLPQKYWPDPQKLDGPIWKTGWFNFHDP